MQILIAEDDDTSRIVLAGVLKKNGYEVIAKSNGLQALEILQGPNAPRLAILDWMMPELDGLEVIRRVRATTSGLPPYILLLTARDEKSDIIVGLETGANDYLAKPFDPGELRARIAVGRRMIECRKRCGPTRKYLNIRPRTTRSPVCSIAAPSLTTCISN
jgi:DNA-binding response OmpR family regulator